MVEIERPAFFIASERSKEQYLHALVPPCPLFFFSNDTLTNHQNMALKDISIKWYEAYLRSSNQIKLDNQL